MIDYSCCVVVFGVRKNKINKRDVIEDDMADNNSRQSKMCVYNIYIAQLTALNLIKIKTTMKKCSHPPTFTQRHKVKL
ncbi:MAG: hypothetical protein ACI8RD_011730 [Bacillariaceae sp.]|jgi:hypothetical protein